MTGTCPIRVARPVTGPACHNPCQLPYHRPGSRVQWQRWSTDQGRFVWLTGTVLAHENRTLTIAADVGVEVSTSCGHVVGVTS